MGKGIDLKPIIKPKEYTMQTCGCGGRSCNGILQKSDPRKIVNGQVYSLSCGFKKEKIEDSKKLSCSHCLKPIDGAYSTIFLKQIRLDFHPGCKYLFKKDPDRER